MGAPYGNCNAGTGKTCTPASGSSGNKKGTSDSRTEARFVSMQRQENKLQGWAKPKPTIGKQQYLKGNSESRTNARFVSMQRKENKLPPQSKKFIDL